MVSEVQHMVQPYQGTIWRLRAKPLPLNAWSGSTRIERTRVARLGQISPRPIWQPWQQRAAARVARLGGGTLSQSGNPVDRVARLGFALARFAFARFPPQTDQTPLVFQWSSHLPPTRRQISTTPRFIYYLLE